MRLSYTYGPFEQPHASEQEALSLAASRCGAWGYEGAEAFGGAEQRCTALVDAREGKKTVILEKAQETKGEATEMMQTYLGGDSDGLDGFEFLTMAEAGEVGHWAVLGKLNESAGESETAELVEWALPIQERHLADAKEGSLKLAGDKDPYEES